MIELGKVGKYTYTYNYFKHLSQIIIFKFWRGNLKGAINPEIICIKVSK